MSISSVFGRIRQGKSSGIALIATCAVGAVAFTCAGSGLVYTNTQHLIQTRQWLEHTHQVLTSLQTESQRLDRVSYNLQLYQLTKNPPDLRAAETADGALQVGVAGLKSLVRDNPAQVRQAQELEASVLDLQQALNAEAQTKAVPEHEIQRARNSLNLMHDEEQRLLRTRAVESQDSGVRSLIAGGSYMGLSLVVVIGLFGFLVRDALRHRRFEGQLSLTNDQLGATVEELERRRSEDRLLKSARDEMQLCVTLKEAQSCACRHLEALVPGSSGATFLINNSRSMLEMTGSWNDPSMLADGFELNSCCGLRAGHSRWREPGKSELNCTHFVGEAPDNYLCLPLAAHGETLGFVFMNFPTQAISGLACNRFKLISELVELSSLSIAGLNLRMKLESQSIRDGLTTLFNRHFMEVALERELQRSVRRGTSLAVLMLDVDHFKVFNDTYGHSTGDEVLRGVAACFQTSVRGEDIVCRYGGEEFAIILPDITVEFAEERAEEIRRSVKEMRIESRGEMLKPVTISIGVAMYPHPARNAGELLRMADRALYEAKRSGRDRTIVANDMGMGRLEERQNSGEPVEKMIQVTK